MHGNQPLYYCRVQLPSDVDEEEETCAVSVYMYYYNYEGGVFIETCDDALEVYM